MCDFFSCLVTREGLVLFCEDSSHEELIRRAGFRDDERHLQHWLRVELPPQGDGWGACRVDETTAPGWWTEDEVAWIGRVTAVADRVRPAQAAYAEAVRRARCAYAEAMRPARASYAEAIRAARAAYVEVERPAGAAYDEAMCRAWAPCNAAQATYAEAERAAEAAYDEAMCRAEAPCNEAIRAAQATYRRAIASIEGYLPEPDA